MMERDIFRRQTLRSKSMRWVIQNVQKLLFGTSRSSA
jgi:hypothetical protein